MLKKSKLIIVFVLLVSFLMNSCHREEELESINTQIAIKKRNISFEELNTKLNKYKKYEVHHGRAGGDEFITSLETDNIVEIVTEVKTTYTLKANTTADDTTSFTNIIFVEKNGELEKYLLRYEPTEAWKTARLTDANISYSGNTIILDFDGTVLAESQVVDGITVSKTSASMTCYEIEWYSDVIHLESYIIIVEIPCDEPTDSEIDAGDSGDGGGADTSGDGDGSTTSGTGTDGDSSNDNGTGDTADTGDDGDPIFTEPVFGDNDGDEDLMAQLNELLCNPVNMNQFNAISAEIVQQILSYYQTNNSGGCSDLDFNDIIIVFNEFPNAKFERYIELTNLIESDPWALIQDCAEQNGLDTANYQNLYQHTIPQECQNRLGALGEDYYNQPITDGNVPLANIDYYAVEITDYPDFNNDGSPDSEAEIYEAYRNNFISLASGEMEDFQFGCNIPANTSNTADINWDFVPFTSIDGDLFVSDNPLTSIFLIEAGADGFFTNFAADEGAIIVSSFTNNNWTISTIFTPDTGTQPFSGNRQWGWLINQNGNLELFTRAVDVARVSDIILKDRSNPFSSNGEECQQNDYYNVAEATWENMQQEITQWINDYGGQATIVPKTAVRVDKEKIKELLESNETINQILCD